jgi:hypothetical protein
MQAMFQNNSQLTASSATKSLTLMHTASTSETVNTNLSKTLTIISDCKKIGPVK